MTRRKKSEPEGSRTRCECGDDGDVSIGEPSRNHEICKRTALFNDGGPSSLQCLSELKTQLTPFLNLQTNHKRNLLLTVGSGTPSALQLRVSGSFFGTVIDTGCSVMCGERDCAERDRKKQNIELASKRGFNTEYKLFTFITQQCRNN